MRHIYTPDRWVIIQCYNPELRTEDQRFDCVVGGWTGGYLDSDYWRRSTPIMRRKDDGDYIVFTGESGSSYRCHKQQHGVTGLMAAVLDQMSTNFKAVGGSVTLLPQQDALDYRPEEHR